MTEAEAATALRHAEKLMADHDLAMAEVLEAGGSLEFACEIAAEFGARTPAYVVEVCRVAESVFGVAVFVRHSRFKGSNKLVNVRVAVFGEASKIEPAAWGIGFLCDTFKRLWTEYRVRVKAPSAFAASYYAGLADGFLARLQAQRDERPASNAIVKVDAAMKAAFEEAFPGMKQSIVKFRGDAAAYGQGVQDGGTINLARPVERASRKAIGG